MTPEQLSDAVVDALSALVDEGAVHLDVVPSAVTIERPRSREHGDYATNVALQLAKQAGSTPRAFAELVAQRLRAADGIAAVDIAGPGFLNISVEAGAQGALAAEIVAAGAAYGRTASRVSEKINVEFVSANPTGPVTLASARWAAVGDTISRLLEATGHAVTREYYFNDHGAQIDRFARSLLASARQEPTPEDGYPGQYIAEIAAKVAAEHPEAAGLPDVEALEAFRAYGVGLMFEEIKQTLRDFRVLFDVYFHENDLYESGATDRALARLRELGNIYEKDGAVWLATEKYGDDKDRVIVKSDGHGAYISGDAAYYVDKRERGFDRCVILLGADHHGYVGRMMALCAAMGDEPGANLEIIIGQMVNLLSHGSVVRMGKRTGNILTLLDLVEAIGVDAARYALVRNSLETNLDIDLDLWTKATSDNPVFYVQYAHARVASILRNATDLGLGGFETLASLAPQPAGSGFETLASLAPQPAGGGFETLASLAPQPAGGGFETPASLAPQPAGGGFDPALLSHEKEGELLRVLAEFPRVVAAAAQLREPHRVARYLEETAATYHRFYDSCRVLPQGDEEPGDLHRARLLLVAATRVVLANGLSLLGVSAPERM